MQNAVVFDHFVQDFVISASFDHCLFLRFVTMPDPIDSRLGATRSINRTMAEIGEDRPGERCTGVGDSAADDAGLQADRVDQRAGGLGDVAGNRIDRDLRRLVAGRQLPEQGFDIAALDCGTRPTGGATLPIFDGITPELSLLFKSGRVRTRAYGRQKPKTGPFAISTEPLTRPRS
jgi:hypothetical protein